MNNIMKLADAYAAVSTGAVPDEDRYKIGQRTKEARAALEAAVEQQAAEIERLNHKDKLITKWTENGSLIERLYSAGIEQERDLARMAAEIAKLQAKLSAMETAPKVAQPLSELQINGMCADANRSHDIDLIDYTKAVRDAEAAHGIGGQHG